MTWHYLSEKAIWGCGVKCGFRAFDGGWPEVEPTRCPDCGFVGRIVEGIMDTDRPGVLYVWQEERV